jgi:ABC-type multidrug transport system ATPase subunit
MAEDRIVLLSTHIIEDVAVLCPNFAVIQEGRIIARTTPSEARQAIQGTIYEAEVVGTDHENEIRHAHTVLQALLISGKRRLRIHLPEGKPPPGFHGVQPTLEDAYFVIMGAGGAPEASAQVRS